MVLNESFCTMLAIFRKNYILKTQQQAKILVYKVQNKNFVFFEKFSLKFQ